MFYEQNRQTNKESEKNGSREPSDHSSRWTCSILYWIEDVFWGDEINGQP